MALKRGNTEVYHDNSSAVPGGLRGKLKGITSSGGASAVLTYNAAHLLASVNWTDAAGAQVEFAYAYYADAERSGLMEDRTIQANHSALCANRLVKTKFGKLLGYEPLCCRYSETKTAILNAAHKIYPRR